MQQGGLDVALSWYEKAIAADPYLRSAYYGAALALRRLKRTDEARAMLADYEKFKDNPRARLAECAGPSWRSPRRICRWRDGRQVGLSGILRGESPPG